MVVALNAVISNIGMLLDDCELHPTCPAPIPSCALAKSTKDIRQWVTDLVRGVGGVDALLAEMRDAGSSNRSNLIALKAHLVQLEAQFENLESSSSHISDAVQSQRDEIERVGRRSGVLDESADTLIQSVGSSRDISESLRKESISMKQLISRFHTSADQA